MAQGRARADLVALGWLVLLVLLYLSPAIKDGPSFGPADLGQGLSHLTALAHAAPNHNIINGDQIDQAIPWNTLDWRLVHRGELPLWNDLSGTGFPQLVNFESAPLALPSLVGYLFPLSLAFLVTIAIKLLICATGAYVCARLLGCRPLAAALAGSTAMLSGSFAGWLGWAISGPLAWAGWILAAAIWCARARRSLAPVALLAVSAAFCIYGGFPEDYALMAFGLGLVLAIAGVIAVARRRLVPAAVGRIALGAALGAALAAPLWLSGLSGIGSSARAGTAAATGLPLSDLSLLVAQGYNGLPIRNSYYFGSADYYESAAYVGVIALVLALVALWCCWRRSAVVSLGVGLLGCLLLVYRLGPAAPVQHLVSHLGLLGTVALQRALPLVGLFLALLAGVGAEAVLARWREARVRAALLGAAVVLASVVGWLWADVGDATMPPADAAQYHVLPSSAALPGVLAGLRRAALIWPSVIAGVLVLGVAVASHLTASRRRAHAVASARRRVGGLALVGLQGAFLVFAGVGINSYAATSFPKTAATRQLAAAAGTRLVALDGGNVADLRQWTGVGFYPEINIGYGIDELGMHDPLIPQSYFDAWPVPDTGQDAGGTNLFVPAVDSATLARRYGAAEILASANVPAPAGTTKLASIPANDGNPHQAMVLYAVPGGSRFSFSGASALTATAASASPGARGASGVARRGTDRVVSASHPGDARYVVHVVTPHSGELAAAITAVAGWRASADGHGLSVAHRAGMLVVAVPAGTSTLTLSYRPPRFALATALALCALVVLIVWVVFDAWRRRRAGGGGAGPLVASTGG
ncbi:MAG: hypothetical protein M0004_01095 [Actinomycetota bacterium]|nr:hypothetical protein [Actinomycetota bacterium]